MTFAIKEGSRPILGPYKEGTKRNIYIEFAEIHQIISEKDGVTILNGSGSESDYYPPRKEPIQLRSDLFIYSLANGQPAPKA